MGLSPGDTDPELDAFSDTEWEVPEDPPELVDARSKLDMHMKHISDQSMFHTHYLEIHHVWYHALLLQTGCVSGSCGSGFTSAYGTSGDDGATMDVSQEGSSTQGVAGLTAASLNPSLEAASKQLNKFAAGQGELLPDLEALTHQLNFSADDELD
jgi:hypothetical protein